MDTISRENNSYLPIAAVIAAVIALVLGAVALVKISATNKTLAAQGEQLARIETIEGEVRSAVSASEKASSSISALQRSTQDAFNAVGVELGNLRGEITKLQESAKAPAPKAAAGKSKEPVVAGPDEYVVKSGDTGIKIARAHSVALADLLSVNPNVNFNKLKVGDKVKLPKK